MDLLCFLGLIWEDGFWLKFSQWKQIRIRLCEALLKPCAAGIEILKKWKSGILKGYIHSFLKKRGTVSINAVWQSKSRIAHSRVADRNFLIMWLSCKSLCVFFMNAGGLKFGER
jgi:hypothetical protein